MLYNANVTLHLAVQIDAPDDAAADALARRRACARSGLPAEHIASVTTTPLTLLEQLDADNRRTWQESTAVMERGSHTLQRRWLAGMVSDDEIKTIAREELFAAFGQWVKRRPMTHESLHSPCMPCGAGTSTWSTRDKPTLTSTQWRTLEALRETAREVQRHRWLRPSRDSVVIEVREHRGVCNHCARSRSQTAALVTIRWAGRDLSREFML